MHPDLKPSLGKLASLLTVSVKYVRFTHVLFVAVLVFSGLSFWLSYEFRFDFQVPRAFVRERFFLLPYVALFKLLLFYVLKGHSANWRYVGIRELPGLFAHCFLGSAGLYIFSTLDTPFIVPKGVILIDFFLSLVFIGGARLGMRLIRERALVYLQQSRAPRRRPALVIGAGDAGEMIIREISRNPRTGLHVKAIFDDDKDKRGLSVHGVRVEGGVEDVPSYVVANLIETAIIAIPSANKTEMKRIYDLLKGLDVSVKTLPALYELIEGSSTLTQLRDIDITDLLGREEIQIDSGQVESLIRGKVVVVTGAGGSIGSELCRQVLKRGPKTLILIERSENSLFHIHRQLQALSPRGTGTSLVPLLCDVCDQVRLDYEFQRFRPELVFHAAAYKHVPMQEINPLECFRNNVGGIQSLARASDRAGVSRFLLISTDKAVKPTSVMGATKRICEIYCGAYGSLSKTKFMSVRFGNVLASEGSVVPIFVEQIAKGGPVTVTHPEMRRYFMTIPEAVTLVLQATALGESGQLMVLDMGEPIRIVDMAQQLMQLLGRDPDEIPIQFVGLRPGEKLCEEITCEGEVCRNTTHGKIKVFDQNGHPSRELVDRIDALVSDLSWAATPEDFQRMVKQIVPEYNPPK
ncbi:MAG: nucleoside-diphosphate sugar epimerase/dehydratase [Thermodesulfobacteriota bacterium]